MYELSLFTGIGLGILGTQLVGLETVCGCEISEYKRRVIFQRQRDGFIPVFPVWDDIRTFDATKWRGKVDVVSGGFPCQDVSSMGSGVGLLGEASGLWVEMARIVGEVRPTYVFVENGWLLTRRGLSRVLADLAALGYDARWSCVGAEEIGANHERLRCWILAYSNKADYGTQNYRKEKGLEITRRDDIARCSLVGRKIAEAIKTETRLPFRHWINEPRMDRMVDGVPNWLERASSLGDGQVPQLVATMWHILGGA